MDRGKSRRQKLTPDTERSRPGSRKRPVEGAFRQSRGDRRPPSSRQGGASTRSGVTTGASGGGIFQQPRIMRVLGAQRRTVSGAALVWEDAAEGMGFSRA